MEAQAICHHEHSEGSRRKVMRHEWVASLTGAVRGDPSPSGPLGATGAFQL
jgi:hypothetical protein